MEGIELGPHALRSGKRVAIPIRNDRCRGILNEMILALELKIADFSIIFTVESPRFAIYLVTAAT